ncbi:hypothetical protein C0J52_07613 [Blattella germanica]|nr:hypothetical protein C0J52_07613 [Blattella germanica]
MALIHQGYGEDAQSRTQVYQWHKRFRIGCQSTDDDPCSGRSRSARTEENITRVAQDIKRDRRQSIDDVATLLGISHGSVQSILHNDLKMQRICEHVGHLRRCSFVAVEDDTREPGTVIAIRRYPTWFGWGRKICIVYYVAYPDPTTESTSESEISSEQDTTEITETSESEQDNADSTETSVSEESSSEQENADATETSASEEPTTEPNTADTETSTAEQPISEPSSVSEEPSESSSATANGGQPELEGTSTLSQQPSSQEPITLSEGPLVTTENPTNPSSVSPVPTTVAPSVSENQSTIGAPSIPQEASTASAAVSGNQPPVNPTSASQESTTGSENRPTEAPASISETQSTTVASQVSTTSP